MPLTQHGAIYTNKYYKTLKKYIDLIKNLYRNIKYTTVYQSYTFLLLYNN